MRYKLTGIPRVDLSLGAYPAVSLKAARLEAVKLNLEIAQGRCPKTCRKDEKQRRERESITFKDAAATFVEERIASSRNLAETIQSYPPASGSEHAPTGARDSIRKWYIDRGQDTQKINGARSEIIRDNTT